MLNYTCPLCSTTMSAFSSNCINCGTAMCGTATAGTAKRQPSFCRKWLESGICPFFTSPLCGVASCSQPQCIPPPCENIDAVRHWDMDKEANKLLCPVWLEGGHCTDPQCMMPHCLIALLAYLQQTDPEAITGTVTV